MTGGLSVVTPSFAPDLPLFRDLHDSVLIHATPGTRHLAVVPGRDRALFSAVGDRPRLEVVDEASLLPRRFVTVPGASVHVNLRRPWPPVRGWILQQILKLAAAAGADDDLVLLVDSDIFLVRRVGPATFSGPRGVHFYVRDGEVDERLPRHMLWHQVSRRLLGLPPAPAGPLPDYVSSFTVWQPSVVRDMLRRIETVTDRPWADAIASCLHFSEFMLYGVFVDEVLGRDRVQASGRMLCHSYWDEHPLTPAAAEEFARSLAPDDVAVMISAKSRTAESVRRALRESLGHSPQVPPPSIR